MSLPSLIHPGPAAAARWAIARCQATPIEVTLPLADTLAASVAHALKDFDGGWLVIEDAPLANLDFLIPGEDPTGAHAAWYAGPHQMGAGQIRHLGLHFGRKDGAPWLHGHGSFTAPDWHGPSFGHVLPNESRLAHPIRARGWGLKGAHLEVTPDTETHFPLFQPVKTVSNPAENAALVTLRPNQDLCEALTMSAESAGLTEARVYGLGSLIHPRLTGQPPTDSYATEILLTSGKLANGTAEIDAEIVTLNGSTHKGRLTPGANPICITAELLLTAP
ncbi:hypothetical protein [Pararhodobacter oceanensis]|uniref:hypothetical protein n=1 Tax=Pararhodobacter oceanensis TaxID=2172121 RepID=UPI003A8F1CC1